MVDGWRGHGEIDQVPALDDLARYEMAADQWTVVDVGSSAAVVGVPGADGTISTFVDLSSDAGLGVKLLDSAGNLLAELPAFPGDPGVFGDIVDASGLWVSEEAVFEIWNDGPDSRPDGSGRSTPAPDHGADWIQTQPSHVSTIRSRSPVICC